jgi:hypothetical protein
MNESDRLHPTVKGYQVWADALKRFSPRSSVHPRRSTTHPLQPGSTLPASVTVSQRL